MAKFIELDPSEITGNVFDRIGKEWMLITAGKPEKPPWVMPSLWPLRMPAALSAAGGYGSAGCM